MSNALTDAQKQEACAMFHERSMTVGQIAEHFNVSIYALTPWIWLSAPVHDHSDGNQEGIGK